MKKLLLLSLILFTALVFQSCKKHAPNIDDEDLVPIVFTDAEVTKATKAASPAEKSLVLGSSTYNNWTAIYSSSVAVVENTVLTVKTHYANGFIELVEGANNSTFNPRVFYNIDDEYVFIKALAPSTAVEDQAFVGKGTAPEKITFTIDGKTDIRATGLPTETPDKNADAAERSAYLGCGSRDNPSVKLHFDHLLSKISFNIVAENSAATKGWGAFKSVKFFGKNPTEGPIYSKFQYDLTAHSIGTPTEVSSVTSFTVKPDEPIALIKEAGTNPEVPFHPGCVAYVYPNTLNVNSATPADYVIDVVTQVVDEAERTTRIPLEAFTLVKGTQYNVNITFHENKEPTFNVKEAPWQKGVEIGDKEI